MSAQGWAHPDEFDATNSAIVLDGIPESIVLGLTLLTGEGVSAAMLAAVFLSNLPEAIAATVGPRRSGWSPGPVMGLWALVTAASGIAALVGYAVLDGATPRTVAFVLAFAGGAILTMLADTVMPEAFEHSRRNADLTPSAASARRSRSPRSSSESNPSCPCRRDTSADGYQRRRLERHRGRRARMCSSVMRSSRETDMLGKGCTRPPSGTSGPYCDKHRPRGGFGS